MDDLNFCVTLDERLRFMAYINHQSSKFKSIAALLAPFLPSVGGPNCKVRRLYFRVINYEHLQFAYMVSSYYILRKKSVQNPTEDKKTDAKQSDPRIPYSRIWGSSNINCNDPVSQDSEDQRHNI